MIRKPIFAANWKMNKGASETEDFVKSFLSKIQGQNFPATSSSRRPSSPCRSSPTSSTPQPPARTPTPSRSPRRTARSIDSGAYTGEISVLMLREFFVHYVILGHSERRAIYRRNGCHHQREDQEGPRGEPEADLLHRRNPRRARRPASSKPSSAPRSPTDSKDVSEKDLSDIVIAYEPVWAIGTGVTATSEQAQEAHAFVRSLIADLYGSDTAAKIRIQYGGSVKPGNAAELMACPDIDGALIGGAALEPQSFLEIIKNGTSE